MGVDQSVKTESEYISQQKEPLKTQFIYCLQLIVIYLHVCPVSISTCRENEKGHATQNSWDVKDNTDLLVEKPSTLGQLPSL